MNYILKFEGNTINYLDHDILVLLNAISNVDKQYLSYAEYNANAENRKDQIDQLERVLHMNFIINGLCLKMTTWF